MRVYGVVARAVRVSRTISGLVHAVVSEDMDTLTFGAPVMLRNLFQAHCARARARRVRVVCAPYCRSQTLASLVLYLFPLLPSPVGCFSPR